MIYGSLFYHKVVDDDDDDEDPIAMISIYADDELCHYFLNKYVYVHNKKNKRWNDELLLDYANKKYKHSITISSIDYRHKYLQILNIRVHNT